MKNVFIRYIGVGSINTLIHSVLFFLLVYFIHTSQALANFLAFCVAVTFSFFANAKWTFKEKRTALRYIAYVLLMGALSALVGYVSDNNAFSPIATLIVFSLLSLFLGFVFSKYIVFRKWKT